MRRKRAAILVLLLALATLSASDARISETPRKGEWITRGFQDFLRGSFGDAGKNLYVSKAGILQRLYQFDLNHDGYLDVLFCNSQEHWEKADVFVYSDVLGKPLRKALASDGAESGVVSDLNKDGYDDLVLAMQDNGTRRDLNAFVYYGDAKGLSERRLLLLPAPGAYSVAASDFNGDGRPDLAFALPRRVRLFYQGPLGFEPKRFTDLEVEVSDIAGGDIEGDGVGDLLANDTRGGVSVYWGNRRGIQPTDRLDVNVNETEARAKGDRETSTSEAETTEAARPIARWFSINGTSYLLVPSRGAVHLAPLEKNRTAGELVKFDCPAVLSGATGDLNGNQSPELVLVSRDRAWIYWDIGEGLRARERSVLETTAACDVAVADLNADHFADLVICQDRTPESYSFHSLVFAGSDAGLSSKPVHLETDFARRVLVGRTSGSDPQVVFVNCMARRAGGDVDSYVYFGGQDGFRTERRAQFAGRGAVGALAADLNDDGIVDLIQANCSENALNLDPGAFVFFGNSNELPHDPSLALRTQRTHGLSCADLNHDGFLDLVFVGFANPDLLIFYGSEAGYSEKTASRIRMEIEGQVYDEPRWIHLADLNRDGWLDLIVPQIAYDRSFILWGGRNGFDLARRQMLSVWHGSFANTADLDKNGWPDLVIGGHTPSRGGPHDSFVHVYWNGPGGLCEDRRSQLPANGVNAVGIRDLNNDGWLDLAVSNYDDNRFRDIDSYIYWGSPEGFAASRFFRLFAHSASGFILNDFDENGWMDIAIAHHKVEGDHLGFSSIWWNGPPGFSAERITRLPTTGPHGMIVVDPGNGMDRGDEEYYLSAPYELPSNAEIESIDWKAQLPPKTWVRAQMRSALTAEGLEKAKWLPELPAQSNMAGLHLRGPWVQYRLALGAKGGGLTPRVSEVRVTFGLSQ